MAAGVPSTNQILPFSGEALQSKSKMGARLSLPGLFYVQPCPSPATVTSNTVTNDGQSLIGAFQQGGKTDTTLPWGGDAVVTFSNSSGLLATFGTTNNWLPTTLDSNDFPVKFWTSTGTLPTGIVAGVTYYYQWVSALTGRLAATPGGSAIAHTDSGSGTIYIQAATQYWGSPYLPAGFLQASDGLNVATPASFPQSGSMYRIEIGGHRKGTGTNNITVKSGAVAGSSNTWTQLTTGVTLANTNTGPFNFTYTADIIVQQYGLAAASSPYVQSLVRSVESLECWSSATAKTYSSAIYNKVVALDTTAPLGFDTRYIAATPAVGEYFQPLWVRMWAFN